MEALVASGRIIDLILILVGIEAVALLAWRIGFGRGPSPFALLSNLLAGAALMVAVRAALTGSHWSILAACLLASLVCHLADVVPRLSAPSGSRVVRPARASRTGVWARLSSPLPLVDRPPPAGGHDPSESIHSPRSMAASASRR